MQTFSTILALCEGNHRSLLDSPHNGHSLGALMFSLICIWTNNRHAGDLRCHHAHYDVTVMWWRSLQLSCSDAGPIWMWFKGSNRYFSGIILCRGSTNERNNITWLRHLPLSVRFLRRSVGLRPATLLSGLQLQKRVGPVGRQLLYLLCWAE